MSLSQVLREINTAWHGVKLNQPDWSSFSHSIAIGGELKSEGVLAHIILNAYWEPLDFELPILSDGRENWRRWIDTALDPPHEICEWNAEQPVLGTTYRAGARSVVVLIAGEGRRTGRSEQLMTAFRTELTYIGVLLAVLAEQLCLPIPSLALSDGRGRPLRRTGKCVRSIIVLLAVLACLAADAIWFWFGRRWGSQAMRLLCRFTADPRGSSQECPRSEVSPLWPRCIVRSQVSSRSERRSAAACRGGRSVDRRFFCL